MNNTETTAKIIIGAGILLVVAGLLALAWARLGWGPWRLPGDIIIKKDNFTFYFPIITCILVSIILSLILNFFIRK